MADPKFTAVFDVDNLVTLEIEIGGKALTLFAEVEFRPKELVLIGLHVAGPGANMVGLDMLRRVMAFLAEKADVEVVVVQGATRTTGANPGRRPKTTRYRRSTRSGPA